MRSLLDFDVTFRSLPTLYAIKGSPRPTVQVTMILEATVDNEVFTDWDAGLFLFGCTVAYQDIVAVSALEDIRSLTSNENIVTRLTVKDIVALTTLERVIS